MSRIAPGLALGLFGAATASADTGFRADEVFAAQELRLWVAQAEQEAIEEGEDKKGILQRMEDTMVRWQGVLSEQVERVGEAADRVFDSEIAFEEINQTSVRIRFDIDAEDGEGIDFDPKLDIKWVLPGAERRLRFVFSSDDDTFSSGDNLGDPLTAGDDERATAALDFSIRSDEKWALSASLGVRSDPQVYTRFRLRRYFELTERWRARFLDRLTYFTDDGWENDFRLDFDHTFGRPLPDTSEFADVAVSKDRRPWLFRSASRIRWFEDKDGYFYEQRFSFFNRLSRRSAIAYEALAFGCTEPNLIDDTEDCREYDLRIRYKWGTKYPWLFFELWPTAAFPESNDFEFTAALRFRTEIWFGKGSRAQNQGPIGL